jgi:hypothetical protein
MSITVRDVVNRTEVCPVTGGVPLVEGMAPQGTRFALRDDEGEMVPVQTSVLARWPDGSARWVLLDFLYRPSSSAQRTYALRLGAGAGTEPTEGVTCAETEGGPTLKAGPVVVSPGGGALLNVSDRVDIRFTLTDADGQVCEAVAESSAVDTEGPLRSTLSLTGAFYTPGGKRVFGFRMRASAYDGLSRIRLEPLILVDADADIVQRIRALELVVTPRRRIRSARLGGTPGWEGRPDAPVRLFQRDDTSYAVESTGETGLRAPGWAEVGDGRDIIAVALRDFWQQWPKSLEASADGLSVGLFPHFRAGDFDHMEPWYKHQYLCPQPTSHLHPAHTMRVPSSARLRSTVSLARQAAL